jgi:hypothetical protein
MPSQRAFHFPIGFARPSAARYGMAHIRLDDQEFELSVGELGIGVDDDAGVRLGDGAQPTTLAIIAVDARGTATVRRTAAHAAVSVNGVALGDEPTPLLHGDRIEVAGRQLRFSDDRKAGSTVLMPALDSSVAAAAPVLRGAAGVSGGRLVSLVDGREYAVPPGGLRIGRDAACDVVVPGSEVSRQHAELSRGTRGYIIRDLSTNGVFVNGQRTGDAQELHRGDVIRIGTEEFRFYAEPATVPPRGDGASRANGDSAAPARSSPTVVDDAGGANQRPARAARATEAPRRATSNDAAEPSRRASVLVWIAAALVIGATLLYVIQDRS